jgi:protein O-mannosyl-transferase
VDFKLDRLPRSLIYLLDAVLCGLGLAYVHGSRIVSNWHVATWEDSVFSEYNLYEIHSLRDCFEKRGAWPGLYRPLTTNLYYYVGSVGLGNRVEAYHFINVVLLILNAILLYRLATLFLGPWWSLIPSFLFASRLALVEVALYATEFQGLLYVFFTIVSVDLFIRSRKSTNKWMLTLSALAFCLALLSKESAIVLPALLIVYGWLFDDQVAIRPYLVHPMIAVSWAILFILVLRPLSHNQPTGFSYDFSVSNVLRNYTTYFLDFSNCLLQPLIERITPALPAHVSGFGGISYAMPARAAAFAGSWYVRLFFGALIISESTLLWFPKLLRTEGMRIVAFGFGWFLIATLPFAIFENRLFMRYSYLGHAGLALCAGAIVRGAFRLYWPYRLVLSSSDSLSTQSAET